MIFWEFLGAAGGLVGAGAGIWAAIQSRNANDTAIRANEIAFESRQEAEEANKLSASANSISGESNRIAYEANTTARSAINVQREYERLKLSADLMPTWGNGIMAHGEGVSRIIRLTLQNRGLVTAHDVFVEMKPLNGRPVIHYHSRVQIQPNLDYYFEIPVGD